MTTRPRLRSRPTTRVGRVFSLVSWPVALGLLVLATIWPFSGAAWPVDLIANLNAQWLLAAVAATLLWIITRRWRHAAIGLFACGLLLISLGLGRAALLPRPMPESPAAARDSDELAVRFLHYNASTKGDQATIESLMDSVDADVISLLCPPVRYQRDVIYGPHLADRFPGKLVRPWRQATDGVNTDITASFLVSRWPIRPIDVSWAGPDADYLITALVERPAGAFAVIAVHPRSPRSADRWRQGNAVVRTVAEVSNRLRAGGVPVVVLTDLNSTPSGHRSRTLSRLARLRRAKPLFDSATTYPLPMGPGDDAQRGPPRFSRGPLGIGIDDALITPGIKVIGWTTLPKRESEHLPILVDLHIQPASTSVAPNSGR
jgi:endonuclease/exonuclease/phosphatase family metal-dependent hydrolase